jgi:hypothetical protein
MILPDKAFVSNDVCYIVLLIIKLEVFNGKYSALSSAGSLCPLFPIRCFQS